MCPSSPCEGRRNCGTNRRKRRRQSRARRQQKNNFLLYFLLYIFIFEEFADVVLAGRDFYETLGVGRDADSGTIKKAYRKLAIKYHPDKNPGDKTAEKMYVELNNAYEVLSDSGKRERYDMYGEDGLRGGDEDEGDSFDPFASMFGFGHRRRRRQEEKRVTDVIMPLAVDLELLYNGGMIDVAHKRQVLCDSWSDCESRCTQCGGQGIVIQTRRLGPGFVQQIQTACPKCGGTGKIGTPNCKSCLHGQFEKEEKIITIDIERGMDDNHKITFEGQTDELPDHQPGNVHFQLHTKKHERFEREGNDLHFEQHISLSEALVGVKRTVKQLDGRMVHIVTDKVISPNDSVRVKGEGMPSVDGGESGDMVVTFWVDFPSHLSPEQKELAIKLLGKPEDHVKNVGGAEAVEADVRDEL